MRRIVLAASGFILLTSLASAAESLAWTRAHELYQRTDYAGSLKELLATKDRDAAIELLMGQDYYGMAQYKQASESLERAIALAPANGEASLVSRPYADPRSVSPGRVGTSISRRIRSSRSTGGVPRRKSGRQINCQAGS